MVDFGTVLQLWQKSRDHAYLPLKPPWGNRAKTYDHGGFSMALFPSVICTLYSKKDAADPALSWYYDT